MSNLGPLAPDHNPFADDQEEADAHPSSSIAPEARSPQSRSNGAASDSELPALQQQHWDEQDQHLDALSASLNRQHEMSLQMNEELDLHQELLEEFDGDVDRTGLILGGAANQLDLLRNSIEDHGMVWILGALIVTLILLIAFFK
ncbi:uncharacterized protein SPSC_03197 [Sporisorium scitamineum]|uniref:t-SNARE coiled-coil homology domain-containing protein n=1 Tax=Sporisorium scitamineum TaxID=49012 RepID=A0A0F7S1R8_9BASI|nr:hypothetical protein [Sporisorium scitamineum]CDS82378.1 uncharacterized protein SPSC_03197 [Sporisorium scitamineum]